MNKARKKGHVAFRSAGSHSPIDVIDIDFEARIIMLVQCKSKKEKKKKEGKLRKEWGKLTGTYDVVYTVI